MTLVIDDRNSRPILKIKKGRKTILKKTGKSIKSLLRFVHDGTQKQNVKDAIIELQQVYMFMPEGVTKMEIKE